MCKTSWHLIMMAICSEARLTGLSVFWIKGLGAWQRGRVAVAWCLGPEYHADHRGIRSPGTLAAKGPNQWEAGCSWEHRRSPCTPMGPSLCQTERRGNPLGIFSSCLTTGSNPFPNLFLQQIFESHCTGAEDTKVSKNRQDSCLREVIGKLEARCTKIEHG